MKILLNKYFFLLSILFFTGKLMCAQSVSVQTDRNQILIGERIEYDLTITLPYAGYAVNFVLPDSVPHFEPVEKGSFDSSGTSTAFLLHRKIIFTSWDSGAWYIPSFPVTLEINNNFKRFSTDSVLINVEYAPDSTNQLRDIKPIIEVNVRNNLWMYLIAAIILALIILAILYNYFKKRKAKPVPAFHSALSAYDEAMNELKLLSKYNLLMPVDIKEYHVRLAQIFRRFYSRISNNNYLNKTTDDLLIKLKEQNTDSTLTAMIAECLRIADAVKFAKYIPPHKESENALITIKQSIGKLK